MIHHGLDPTAFSARSCPSGYVCFVGRLSEVKGPAVAIDVAQRAGVQIRVGGSVHLVDEQYAERELNRRLNLPHVTYLGPVDMRAKSKLLRDARAILAPIAWNEPFGLIVIEAMLSGCPVVGFPRGSLPELIEPGVTGYLADTEEEMVDLIRPGGLVDSFDRLRCRARAIERFSSERMVADYERLYARVLVSDPHARPGRTSRVA